MNNSIRIIDILPRLPLEGSIDLTYRCNNNCRHCWLWVPNQVEVQNNELTFEEIRRIVDEARAMGCRRWSISGGEPLLRPDFPEIFEYIIERSVGYTLNTNGTLITPKIAQLLKRKGTKMVALYGATADVYDNITRHSGGFEKVMQGFAYLKEAGANCIVQLIPMKDNYHQWNDMVELAEKISPHWRVGAPWLYLSFDGSPVRNKEIAAQRLSPEQVIELDKPRPSYNQRIAQLEVKTGLIANNNSDDNNKISFPDRQMQSDDLTDCADERLIAGCIDKKREFHIDAYGQMSWCSYIKDPIMRFDLRKGSFQEGWDVFIPSCSGKIRGTDEWHENCGNCSKREDCRWCAAYAYLETGRYSAPIPYLCKVSEEAEQYIKNWKKKHQRYFQIAGITIQIESDIDFESIAFNDALETFAVDDFGDDNITLRHHFELPDLKEKDLGQLLYQKMIFRFYHKNGSWLYQRYFSNENKDENIYQLAVFSNDYRTGTVFSPLQTREDILLNGWNTLSLFPTDQIWLLPILADRKALLLHSAAAIIKGKGYLFVGGSESGKSTTVHLLKAARNKQEPDIEILCDEHNIVRHWQEGWHVHGTWRHSSMPAVSTAKAPLSGIFFLEKAAVNTIVPLNDRKLLWRKLLTSLIRVVDTGELWEKKLDILEELVQDVPCYTMRFDKTGKIISELELLAK